MRIKNVRECFILFALLMPVARADESVGKGDAAAQASSNDTYTYAFTGDIMFGRYFGGELRRHDTTPGGTFKVPYPLDSIRSLLEAPHYTVANLENPILDRVPEDLVDAPRQFTTRLAGTPEDARRLKGLGVDFVSLANNHINDAYADGLKQTIEYVEAAQLQHAGARLKSDPYAPVKAQGTPFETYIFAGTTFVNRIKVPINFNVAVAPTRRLVNAFLPRIKALRQERPNALIVFALHWGPENQFKLMDHQRRQAQRLIDAGVDVIAGHHPHVLHPVEVYRGGVILYSLGNLFFDQSSEHHRQGMVAHIKWRVSHPDTRPKLVKIQLHGTLRPRDFGSMQLATKNNRSKILGRIKRMSAKDHRTRFKWSGQTGTLLWE